MNYTITLTYSELINLAALLQDHIGLCHDLDYEVEAAEHQATKDKIWSRLSGHPDPEEDIPAADMRPVVFCKDCKYYEEGKLLGPTKFCYYYQIGTGLNTADDDFCSKGERRANND